MSKVSLIAKLPLQPGKRDAFVEAFTPMMEAVKNEAGTEVYILNFQDDDENVVWVYELYTDSDAMAVHSGSETMATLFGALGDLLGGAPELIPCTPHLAEGVDL
jgi:quinol monooxygenase YgiN